MKNITKKITAFILLFLLTAGNVSATNIFSLAGSFKSSGTNGKGVTGVVWNSGATGHDCPTINIANVNTGIGYATPCWTGTNIYADPGQTVKVKVYYHNTTSTTATNTHIRVIKTGNSFKAQILSPEGSLTQSGSVSVTIPSSQELIFKETFWYPDQTQNNTTLLNNQSDDKVFSDTGLYIGDITGPGFQQQGSVVVSFLVGSTTPPPQNCVITDFHASPTSVNSGGDSSLSWKTNDCTSVNIYNKNTGALIFTPPSQYVSEGFFLVRNITNTTTYTLKAYKQGGTVADTQDATVTVNTTPPPTCLITSFIANPATINSGQSSTLSWVTSGCSYVKLYNGATLIGQYTPSSYELVRPVVTTTYTLKAYTQDNIQRATKNVTVIVNNTPPPICSITSFTTTPSTIIQGDSSNLSWTTSNCASTKLYNAFTLIGTYGPNGNKTVSPVTTTIYTVKAYSQNGVQADLQTVTVKVKTNTPAMTGDITALQPSCVIPANGSTCLIPFTWSTQNPVGISAVTNNNQTVAVGNNGNQSFHVSFGPQTYYLYNSAVELDHADVSTSCAIGSTWNEKICKKDTIPEVCTINSFSANPLNIIKGGSSTISWNTSNCTRVDISNIGNNLGNIGSNLVRPTQDTTYVLKAYDANGSTQTSSVTVNVETLSNQGHTTPVCKINSFSVNPQTIKIGDTTTVKWDTENCTRVNISNIGNNLGNSGSKVVKPTEDTTYTLKAYGTNGSIQTRSVMVVVNENITPTKKCTISYFYGDPSSIEQGDSSELKWSTNNCNEVSIDGVEVQTSGTKTVWPTQTKTYTLKASGGSFWGIGGNSVTAQTTVSVNGNNHNDERCQITRFVASDTTITNGDFSILEWNTINCAKVKISNIGNVSKNGSEKVYPNETTTYVLTAYDYDGSTETDSIKINVDDGHHGGGGSSSTCRIDSYTTTDNSINRGEDVTLNWRTTGCNEATISNIGNVSLDGSRTIAPAQTMTLTLKVYRNGVNKDSKSIQINVNNQNGNKYNTDVVTLMATNISQNGAQLNGLITTQNYNNSATHFEYGTTVNLGSRTNSKNTVGYPNFSEYVSGLNPNTYYFYRAVLEKPNGTYYGAFEVFKTTKNGNVPIYINNDNTRQIINQGTTVFGSESPVMLRIENRYQTIGVGDTIDYEVYYKNISASTLTNPMVQVFIPEGIIVTNTSDGTYSEDDRTLSVPIDDLNPNDEGYIYIQAEVDSIDSKLAQIVTTALLIFTNPNGAQENAMAYVLNTPKDTNLLGASAFFGIFQGMGLICWLFLIIIILLLILIARYYYNNRKTKTTTTYTTTSNQ